MSEHSRNPNADQLPFTVDHEQVGRRAFASGVIRIIAQAVKLVLVIGTGMTLARLLTPADFGLFAMVGSLTAFVGSFRDFGLPAATVHQAQIDQRQIDALFWINLRWNGLVLLFMLVMAPILAWFYGEVALVTITLAVAIGMFGAGSAVLPEALLTRQMRFGALTLIDLGALAVGAACGIGLAFAGAAYWALVGQLISEYLIRGGAYWLVCGWRPRRLRPGERQAEVADIITYSKDVTIFRVIAHIGRNLDRVVVGYTGGPAAMGLYDRAYQWSTFPMLNVYGPLLSVAVASLSRVRDHADRYRSYARQALLPIFTSVLPALAFMFVEARAVIRLLLGEQWLAAVPIFRLLCAAAFVGCAGTVTKIIYHSLGTTRRQLHWGLFATPLMILAVLIGSAWGPLGVASGFALGTMLLAFPHVAYCLHGSPLSFGDFIGIVWRPASAAIGAATLLMLVRHLLPAGIPVIELLVKATLFGLGYLLLWSLFPGGRRTMIEAIAPIVQRLRRAIRRDGV